MQSAVSHVDICSRLDLDKPHEYICENFESEVRVRTSDREIPGPISCSADVMPFAWTMNIRHHQYVQYRLLQTAIKSQQRFDTMLRQRPKLSPKEDAKAWWHYHHITQEPTVGELQTNLKF